MTKHFALFLTLISLSLTLFADNTDATFQLSQKVQKDYAVLPADLKATLDANKGELKTFMKPTIFGWLSGFYIKKADRRNESYYGEPEKIIEKRTLGHYNATKTLAEHPEKMSKIKVPKKYLYKGIPTPSGYTPEYVIAERVYDSGKSPNVEQTKQLADFIVKTGWDDAHGRYYIVGNDDNVYIIDTPGIMNEKSFSEDTEKGLEEEFKAGKITLRTWLKDEHRENRYFMQQVARGLENLEYSGKQEAQAREYLKELDEHQTAKYYVEEWVHEKLDWHLFDQERLEEKEKIFKEIDQKVNHIESQMDYQ